MFELYAYTNIDTSTYLMYILAIIAKSPDLAERLGKALYREVLEDWGQTWLWDEVQITGGTNWIAEAIADNSLDVATDGSYL